MNCASYAQKSQGAIVPIARILGRSFALSIDSHIRCLAKGDVEKSFAVTDVVPDDEVGYGEVEIS